MELVFTKPRGMVTPLTIVVVTAVVGTRRLFLSTAKFVADTPLMVAALANPTSVGASTGPTSRLSNRKGMYSKSANANTLSLITGPPAFAP